VFLLATDHPTKGTHRLERPASNVVAAITAGDGPSVNPKRAPNEDSLAVVPLSDGVAALVADAHFGPSSGEIAARGFASAVERAPPRDAGELVEIVIDLDLRVREERARDDDSETTALAVIVRGARLAWASVGDSVLFLAAGGTLARLTRPGIGFVGGGLFLKGMRQHRIPIGDEIVEAGSLALPRGAVVVAATDGIEAEFSGMTDARLGQLLLAPDPLDARVANVMLEAGRADRGGGRDNLAIVAIEVSA
jgi:hypothetical protein